MEAEKVAPIAKSPLDSARGRGLLIRIKSRRASKELKQTLAETPRIIIINNLPESPYLIGIATNGK